MSLFGMPKGTPCCCLSGCCEGLAMPDCLTLELTSSCCAGETATVVLTKEGGTGCVGGDPRPYTAAEFRCEPTTPALIYTGSIPDDWCAISGLGDATVNVFCCIDAETGEGTFWIYIGGSDLGVDWYPASSPHYYQLTLISCDPLLLQINAEPPDCGDTCVWTFESTCFIGTTLIRTPHGDVEISSLKRGDVVVDMYGQDVVVMDIIVSEVSEMIRLTGEDDLDLGVTPEHPFVEIDGSFILARDLTDGHKLPLGKTAVKKQTERGRFTVYNLSVDGSHTFIADGFAVHNKGNM